MSKQSFLLVGFIFSFSIQGCEREAVENLKKVLLETSTPNTNRTKIMVMGACTISSVLATAYCWKKLFEVKENTSTTELINIEPQIDLFSQSQDKNLYPNIENNQQDIANKKVAVITLNDFIKAHKNKLKVIGGITVGTLLSIHFAKKYMTECLTFNLIDNYYEYAIKFCNGNFFTADKHSRHELNLHGITTGTYHILKKMFTTGKV